MEKEKKDVSALLEKKSAELDAQRKQTEETEANLRDMIDIKHQLLVANDMLAAVKAQRQDLFAEVEKEKSERTELQQKLLISEETLRQFENDQQIDRKNIRALMAEIAVTLCEASTLLSDANVGGMLGREALNSCGNHTAIAPAPRCAQA